MLRKGGGEEKKNLLYPTIRSGGSSEMGFGKI
jgi:hypothetical protein